MNATRIAVALACAVAVSTAIAQSPSAQKPADTPPAVAQQKPADQQTAGERFKNIQVLKNIPADDLQPTMRYISAALGVECSFCHVRNPDFQPEKDDKEEKRTARDMMKMVMTINQENFEGRQEVSCNSCHNGHNRPQSIPPSITEAALKERIEARANQQRGAVPGQPPAAAPAQSQPAAAREARPTAESLFQKYEQAIGGSDAISKITSLYTRGTVVSAFGNQEFEQYNKAPDKFWVSTSSPRGARVQAWDGSQGWTRTNRVQPMRDVSEVKATSDFYRNLKFAGRFKGARVFRKEKVGDHDAWVVMVRTTDTPLTDMLYFDVDSGLLVRRTTLRRTALGPLPNTADFADYRDVGGVKMPYKVTLSNPDSIQTVQVSDMKVNVPVEDSRFAMPKDAAPAGN